MLDVGEAIGVCHKKWLAFKGRASWSEYWWFVLYCVIINVIIEIVTETLVDNPSVDALSFIYSVFLSVALTAAAWRRLHDTGRSGSEVLWFLGLFWLFIFWLIFDCAEIELDKPTHKKALLVIGIALFKSIKCFFHLCQDSQHATNEFGIDPTATMDEENSNSRQKHVVTKEAEPIKPSVERIDF